MRWHIILDIEDCKQAEAYARDQIRYTEGRGCRDFTVPQNKLHAHAMGVRGEFAVLRYLGQPLRVWTLTEFYNRKLGDVLGFEVRTTAIESGRLIVNPRDEKAMDRPFLLVHELATRRYRFVGWLYGHEARRLGVEKVNKIGETYWIVGREKLRCPFTLLDQYKRSI